MASKKRITEIFLFGEINDQSCKEAYEHVIRLRRGQALTLHLESGGGATDPAYALIAAIERSKGKVIIIGSGCVGSAALDVFVSGHERLVTPGTIGLAHNCTWEVALGRYTDIPAKVRLATLEWQRGAELYKRHTKHKTDAELERHLFHHQDVWLTPEEMVEHGIADKVLR